jgi:hypothetical protein
LKPTDPNRPAVVVYDPYIKKRQRTWAIGVTMIQNNTQFTRYYRTYRKYKVRWNRRVFKSEVFQIINNNEHKPPNLQARKSIIQHFQEFHPYLN